MQMQEQSQISEPTKECYSCGRQMSADAKTCPACGRRQYRICYCGNEIPVDAAECPHCGADWSDSRRVKRRKSRSGKVNSAVLLRSAGIGAVIALVIAGLLNVVISYFATIGAQGDALPDGFLGLLDMAWMGLRRIGAAWWQAAAARRGSILAFVICVAVGAGIGAAASLAKVGVLKLRRQRKKGSSRRRSSRSR